MCRVLLYMGKPLLIADLLFDADNALIKQAYAPTMMHAIQNLAGFGMAAWQQGVPAAEIPVYYRSKALPFYDRNLSSLSRHLKASTLLAHIRGVNYSQEEIVTDLNCHPFKFDGSDFYFAHNGSLAMIDEIKHSLHRELSPQFSRQINGTTDSEWIYALFLSRLITQKLDDTAKACEQALLESFDILYRIRKKHTIQITSPLNLFITNGDLLISTRFVFDYGYFPPGMTDAHFIYHSLWYTYGDSYQIGKQGYTMCDYKQANSIIIASEPTTLDTSTWIEVPEYSLFTVQRNNAGALQMAIHDIEMGG